MAAHREHLTCKMMEVFQYSRYPLFSRLGGSHSLFEKTLDLSHCMFIFSYSWSVRLECAWFCMV